jgi:hypothetical protein
MVFAALAVLLFFAAFITRRRFGLLGLALAAGSILSTIWDVDAGLIVGTIGIFPSGPLTTAITLSIIVLLPAIVLLFHGYTYKNLVSRIIGALLFTLLALAFLVQPLGHALPLEGFGANFYNMLVNYKEVIISIGVALAVVDLFFTKPAAPLIDRKSKR